MFRKKFFIPPSFFHPYGSPPTAYHHVRPPLPLTTIASDLLQPSTPMANNQLWSLLITFVPQLLLAITFIHHLRLSGNHLWSPSLESKNSGWHFRWPTTLFGQPSTITFGHHLPSTIHLTCFKKKF